MLTLRYPWLLVFLLGLSYVFISNASALAGEKKEGKAELLFSKNDSVTDDDEKDTKLKKSHRKMYTVKLTEGKTYRIDLSSKEFDTFLRLETAAGKEVAFNDDIDFASKLLDSRIIYTAPKTGDYKIIVTSFDAKMGSFTVEMKLASEAESTEAVLAQRVASFGGSPLADQKKLVQEVTKAFVGKGDKLTFKDAQTAALIAYQLDEDDIAFTRGTLESFSKIFANTTDKRAAGLPKFLESLQKKFDMIGKDMEVTGKTTDGKEFDLKKLKGKVILVDFWATWCGPCIAEIPNIISAHEKYNAKGFEVIGVSLDRTDEAITKFLDERKLPWRSINIEDSRKLADKYDVNAIPQPILIGRDGRVVSMRARGPQLERLLEKLLGEKK